MKNAKLLKTLETEIHLYAITHSSNTTKGFVYRIFGYLRANMHLLKDTNYEKLYKECLLLLQWLDRKILKEKNANKIHEIVTDLIIKRHNTLYEKIFVEKYLKFRIDSWNTNYYDKLYK